jgi:hypothetical protein
MLKTNLQRENYALLRMSAALDRVFGSGSKEAKS